MIIHENNENSINKIVRKLSESVKQPTDKDLRDAIKSKNPIDLRSLLASLPKFTEIYYTDKYGNNDFGRKLTSVITSENDPNKNGPYAYRSEWLYFDDMKTCNFGYVLRQSKKVSFKKFF